MQRREETVSTAPPDSSSDRHKKEIERWFLELRDPVFRYLRTLGCRRPLAEEITQESFFRLHSALKSGLRIKDVRAWVFRVARNLSIDNRRERRRFWTTARGEEGRLDLLAFDSAPDPEQQMLQRERVRLIEQQMSRLPKLEQECMRLKAQGLRYRQIAAALDIPMTTAVESVRRAVKRLAKLAHE
jgi:RNA polymerase sigma-70 factor (ECF subfamily)